METNLKQVMQDKNISMEAVASLLGIHRNTASNKINGDTPFTIQESFKLKKNLFPEYDMEFLFGYKPDKAS